MYIILGKTDNSDLKIADLAINFALQLQLAMI